MSELLYNVSANMNLDWSFMTAVSRINYTAFP